MGAPEYRGFTIEITQDHNPESPAENDNLGEILYAEPSRYALGYRGASPHVLNEIAGDPENITLPVYAYVHGDIALSTAAFACPWDSGQSGIVWVSRQRVRDAWGVKRISAKLLEKVRGILRAQVDEYSQYLSGDVWCASVSDGSGQEDSCCGLFGLEYAKSAGRDMVDEILKCREE